MPDKVERDFCVCLFVKYFESISSLPLTFRVSDEKSVDNLIEDPLCLMSHFFLADFKLSVFQQCDYNVSQYESLVGNPTLNLLTFLDFYIHVFHQIWECFGHYLFR